MPIFSPQSELLPNIAGFFGTLPIFIGIDGLLRPRGLLAAIDFPAASTPTDQKLVDGMTRIYAVRNVVIGLICSSVWYRGDRKLLGGTMIIASLSPVLDAFVSLDLIGGGLRNHLPFVPIAIGLGVGLLGWI